MILHHKSMKLSRLGSIVYFLLSFCRNTDKIKDSNARGKLVLGYKSDDKKDPNEHLDLDHPLARDIKLKNGEYKIKVPNVVGRSTYIVVLFGDSGNASQEFTITNPDAHA